MRKQTIVEESLQTVIAEQSKENAALRQQVETLTTERDEFKGAWEAASDHARKAIADMARERITRKQAEADRDRLAGELETEQMRLVACTAALGNTPESVSPRIAPGHPYYSASYGDVCDAVDREMALRAENTRIAGELAEAKQRVRLAGEMEYAIADAVKPIIGEQDLSIPAAVNLLADAYRDLQGEQVKLAGELAALKAHNARVVRAATNADWEQVRQNGGSPCFWIDETSGRFCLRAERWLGHPDHHAFVTLDAALTPGGEK